MSMPGTKPDAPTPKPRRYQFTLAELLTFTTFVAVAFSLLTWSSATCPLVAVAGVLLVAGFCDRRWSHRFTWRTLVAAIVALILIAIFLALQVLLTPPEVQPTNPLH